MTRTPIRVMRLIARLNVGGPARHVVWLNEDLAADELGDEFEPLLVTGTVPPGEEDMTAFAAAHGVTPVIIPSMSREMSARDLFAVWDVWRLMVRFRPDVLHTHTAKAGAVGRLAGLLYRFATPRAREGVCRSHRTAVATPRVRRLHRILAGCYFEQRQWRAFATHCVKSLRWDWRNLGYFAA